MSGNGSVGVENRRQLTPIGPSDCDIGVIGRFRSVLNGIPDAVAVADGDHELTFAGLAARAAVVRTAIGASVPNVRRPLSSDRLDRIDADCPEPIVLLHSHDTGAVAALLGILASGNPVLVLDPRTPPARLATFVERTGARYCVTDQAMRRTAEGLIGTVLVAPGTPSDDVSVLWENAPDPGDPAALAFTSGSTGRPKVVVNDHRMLVRDAWVNSLATRCYGADDVIAHTLPMAFHAGLMVTVAGMLVGSTMRLYDVRNLGIGGLAEWLAANRATVMHSSPAILRAFVGTRPNPALLTGLRALTIAGETAHGGDVEAARALLPAGCTVRNRYGSSETGLVAEYPVPVDHPVLEGPLPVGFGVGDTVIGLVGEDGGPVAPGEAGTVTVTSPAPALGYWHDRATTADTYTDNPDGTRTYRTNDIGRLDPDGALRLLGRRDHSVKIRGYLVEPGEVDAALFALPEVREALVVGLPRPTDGLNRLIAYVVPATERPSAVAIRAALHQSLPGYMVPETVVFLESLPRTDRGKLDRSALPEAPAVVAGRGGTGLSEWEKAVATVWQKVLSLPEVGLEDDFFELGGDSLAAEALISLVVSELGVPDREASTSLLVQAPTLREFAGRVHRRPDRTHPTLIPLRPTGSRPPLFVMAGGGGLGVAFVPLVRHLDAEQPVYALQSHALERRGIPDWSVQAAARRNLATIRSVQPNGPYYLAGHSFGGLVALEMSHQLHAAGEQVDLLILLDSFPPDPTMHEPISAGSLSARAKRAVGLATTGIKGTPGLDQYWRFYRQSELLHRRFRCDPWHGETLVVLADSPERAARAAWGPHLVGPWRTVDVPGDHLSMIRDPYAADTARVIAEALARVRSTVAAPSWENSTA